MLTKLLSFFTTQADLPDTREAIIGGCAVPYDRCSSECITKAMARYANYTYLGEGSDIIINGEPLHFDTPYHFFKSPNGTNHI